MDKKRKDEKMRKLRVEIINILIDNEIYLEDIDFLVESCIERLIDSIYGIGGIKK